MDSENAADLAAAAAPAQEVTRQIRLTALGAGNMRRSGLRELRAVMRETDGDQFRATRLGLARLRADGWVEDRDLDHLKALVDVVEDASRRSELDAEIVEKVRHIHHALVADGRSSPPALAIASLVNSLMTPTEPVDDDGRAVFRLSVGIGREAGDALAGAVLGALLGAPGGFGGIVGGAIAGGTLGATGICRRNSD